MRTTLLKKGIREIWAHKVQYTFLILILGLGVAAYGSLNDMQASRLDTFEHNYEECHFQDVRFEFQYGVRRNLSDLKALVSGSGIASSIEAIEYRFSFDVFLNHTDDGRPKLTKGIMMGYEFHSAEGGQREITVNRPLPYGDYEISFDSMNVNDCYVEHNFARVYDLGEGDYLEVMNGANVTTLDILNEVSIPEYFMVLKEGSFLPQERSLGVLAVPMGTAMRIYGTDVSLSDNIAIRLKEGTDMASFKENATRLLEMNGIPVRAIEKEEDAARMMVRDDIEGDSKIFQTFPLVIFTVSGFGLFMTLRRMVQTHKVQIGIFKSLGVPDRVVLVYFASIGMMVAVLGVILGIVLSIPLNMWFLGIMETFFGFPMTVYTTKYSYYITGAVVSLLICFACTVVPAWTSLRVKPVDTIQQREGISKKKVGRLATKVGRHGGLATPLKLTVRNLLRRPGRTTTSVLGVGLSLSLFLSFMIIMQTMFVMVDDWNNINRWDYEVETDGFYPVNGTASWVQENPEISEVHPAILLPTMLRNGDKEVGAIVHALDDIKAVFKVEFEKGGIRKGELVISFYHRDELGVDVGDAISIDVPVLDPELGLVMTRKDIRVCGIQDNNLGFYGFMDLLTLTDMTGLEGLANMVYLETSDGKRSLELENGLIHDPGVSSVTHFSQIGNIMEEYFDLFMAVVYAISVISTSLAAAIIYNLFMISANERRRDYATMKTLGTSLPRLSRLIFLEAGFITVPGIVLGCLGGWGLAYYMLKVATTFEGINIILRWSWAGFAAGSAIMVTTVILVSILTIRYVSKIVIANVIRERSTG